ncbi:hypothetical protein DEJ51_27505 [Streptomyces venezuelae]|uniref:Uncharacterized protein n=1 Tax=Streptomyces venezuelae TaxID=54571 RepID=A0A5P2DXU8_STRVZ|nr:hypothetical protein DEJ51_27505 [Streptomyces venezuelae]
MTGQSMLALITRSTVMRWGSSSAVELSTQPSPSGESSALGPGPGTTTPAAMSRSSSWMRSFCGPITVRLTSGTYSRMK